VTIDIKQIEPMPRPASTTVSQRLDPGFGTALCPYMPTAIRTGGIRMIKHLNPSRRDFLSTTAIGLGAVAEFTLTGAARAQTRSEQMSEHVQVDGIYPFPAVMQTRTIETNGTSIHVRVGGHGSAVVLLHGFGTSGDMWGHLASALIEDRTIIVPDLRGSGLSSKPDGGYDKKNLAADVVGVVDALGVRTFELVTHDIGIMVGYAVAATRPERVSRWVAIDAPLPGIGPWEKILQEPAMWHFGFGGHDMERLVAGRERIYLDRFWNELSRHPERFDEAKRQHYAALYAQPGAMRAGFAQFLSFSQDAIDNKAFLAKGKLQMPVLALGGEATFAPMIGEVIRGVADNVEVVTIPDCGHWITEEQPAATTKLVVDFLPRRS
jgi:pimeloyl-ACP methyl ester carboxylesterase